MSKRKAERHKGFSRAEWNIREYDASGKLTTEVEARRWSAGKLSVRVETTVTRKKDDDDKPAHDPSGTTAAGTERQWSRYQAAPASPAAFGFRPVT